MQQRPGRKPLSQSVPLNHTLGVSLPPRLRPNHLDPLSTARRKPISSPGNLALFTGMAGFGLYATGHLQALDRFFDQAQHFGRAHNDVVVHGLLYWLPIGLALCLGAGAVVVGALRLRKSHAPTSRPAASHGPDTRNARTTVAPEAHRTVASLVAAPSPVEPEEELEVRLLPTPLIFPSRRPATAGTASFPAEPNMLLADERPEAKDERHAAKEVTEDLVPHATSSRVVSMPVPPPLLAATGTDGSPGNAPRTSTRRRRPRGTLPPHIAAALRSEVASTTLIP